MSDPNISATFQFESLGHLRSCFSDRFGTPRQPNLVPHSRGSLKIRGELNPSAILMGLEKFSHVWLIWVFHQNTNKVVRPKIHPPRLGGESIGVFASRSPHRPNPIGLSLVRLDRIENDTLHFREIDLIDGTPILDIKPFVAATDGRVEITDSWASEVPWKKWTVLFSPAATEFLNASRLPVPRIELENLLREVLEQDPRPLVYKGDAENPSPYREDYFIYLYNLNVRFRYLGDAIVVEAIEFRK